LTIGFLFPGIKMINGDYPALTDCSMRIMLEKCFCLLPMIRDFFSQYCGTLFRGGREVQIVRSDE